MATQSKTANAFEVTITGRPLDKNNSPIAGMSIMLMEEGKLDLTNYPEEFVEF